MWCAILGNRVILRANFMPATGRVDTTNNYSSGMDIKWMHRDMLNLHPVSLSRSLSLLLLRIMDTYLFICIFIHIYPCSTFLSRDFSWLLSLDICLSLGCIKCLVRCAFLSAEGCGFTRSPAGPRNSRGHCSLRTQIMLEPSVFFWTSYLSHADDD